MAAAERIARGESPSDAIAAARREFGNVGHVKEVTRETWAACGSAVASGSAIRVALTPAFAWLAAVAIGTLALGIGANAAMFTVVNGVLVRPLLFDEPSRPVIASYEPERRSSIGRDG
jgi:putative ABC transport system permease protein